MRWSALSHKISVTGIAIFLTQIPDVSAADSNLLKRVHDAEIAFDKAQNDSATIDWDGFKKLRTIERDLLVLKGNNSKTYLPVAVYSAHQIKNNFDLSEMVADDTIHVTEEYDYTPIAVKDGETFTVATAWDKSALTRCDFYLGHPGKMHQDGYKAATRLQYANGKVKLPARMEGRDLLLFAIAKPANNQYFKFVFVVRSNK